MPEEPNDRRSKVPPTAVLGIGNILLTDEGVGVRVIEAMARRNPPPGVELIDGGTAGADLVDLIADRCKLIVVDAIDAGAEPGTIVRLGPGDLVPEEGATVSLHQIGLLESLAIARCLGCAPREVVVFGIQPKRIAPGLELTPELAAVVPQAIRAIRAELGIPRAELGTPRAELGTPRAELGTPRTELSNPGSQEGGLGTAVPKRPAMYAEAQPC